MNDFARVLVGTFAAVAPLGALPVFLDARVGADARGRVVAVMFVVSLLAITAAAFVSGPFLDWLDVSPENFQLAAGVIMLPQALQLIGRGRTLSGGEYGAVVPLAAPVLAGPASMAAAMSYATRFGEGEAVAGAAVVLLVTAVLMLAGEWIKERTGNAVIGLLGRLNGGLLVIIAIEMAVDGVRSV